MESLCTWVSLKCNCASCTCWVSRRGGTPISSQRATVWPYTCNVRFNDELRVTCRLSTWFSVRYRKFWRRCGNTHAFQRFRVWVGFALGSCQQRPRGCWMCWRWLEVPACGAHWGRSAAPAAPLPARSAPQEGPAPGPREARQGEHGGRLDWRRQPAFFALQFHIYRHTHLQAHQSNCWFRQHCRFAMILACCHNIFYVVQSLLCQTSKNNVLGFCEAPGAEVTHCF